MKQLLRKIRGWLTRDGAVVASISNVRHCSVISGLLEGNWTYEAAWLLDAAHLTFFTRRVIETLFSQAGFQIASLHAVRGPGYDDWERQGRPGSVRLGSLALQGLSESEAEEFFVYQYLVRAVPAGKIVIREREAEMAPVQSRPSDVEETPAAGGQAEAAHAATRTLSILYIGDFESPGKAEQYAARALASLGHRVKTVHDASVASAEALLEMLEEESFDCFLFYKGCLGAKTIEDRLHPTGEEIGKVLRHAKIPGYTWYFDRVYQYDFDPSREAWMRTVAPLCRVAFVTDGALGKTDWARWHVLRQGVCRANVEHVFVPEKEKEDIGFLGQIYGEREDEMAATAAKHKVNIISGVFDRALNRVVRSHKIILGPRFPSIPHYWSNRLYVVLGHGGFFLAPEVEAMREEGFIPGLHYAALGDDPLRDIDYWLNWPAERERIARAGQELVLSRFTYEDRVTEMLGVIEDTL